jgi:hypothetical protein
LIASKALDKNQPEYEWINLNLKLPRQGKSPKKKQKTKTILLKREWCTDFQEFKQDKTAKFILLGG